MVGLAVIIEATVVLLLVSFAVQSLGLTTDGVLLLAFKFSVVSDPLFMLQNWNFKDQSPCSWRGVSCTAVTPGDSSVNNYDYFRVTGVSLPNSQFQGSIPANIGMIEHLQILDLSNNSLNGSIPLSLFNAAELRFLDLSNNVISGEIPDVVSQLRNLYFLNLSDNALAGKLPITLNTPSNLTVVSLKNNYLSGSVPGGFRALKVLDLSSNLINGSLPPDFGGNGIRYLNISYNRVSGEIPHQFAEEIPRNATIDLSFNNLTGVIPDSEVLLSQETVSFAGNSHLCGKPSKNQCLIPSSPFSSPNASSTSSPSAIAAIPNTIDSNSESNSPSSSSHRTGLKTGVIIAIVIGHIVGIGIFSLVITFIYRSKKKKDVETTLKEEANTAMDNWSSSSSESRGFTRWSCLRKRGNEAGEEDCDTLSSDTDEDLKINQKGQDSSIQHQQDPDQNKKGTLVTVNGEKDLELETLLKASAYILGATGSSIMYKAVLEDGSALAVRRIGENSVDRFRNFDTQIRVIAKLVHPNLVRIHGFYWGIEEKLIIYDFVPNGSLANARYRKPGSSPCHLPWETRLKVVKGVARGLAYLHDKKHIHGNLKPSNILLGLDMEPRIGDFGLEKLFTGESSSKAGGSARIFGSKRSTASRDSFQDISIGPSPSPSPSSFGSVSPYHAPEALRSLKPNPKWDVYSFGVILLELLTGKVTVIDELGQGNGLVVEDKIRALRMADVAIRADVEGKEETLLSCFKLGYSCASPLPQKRPQMKEVIQVLEKMSFSGSSSSHFYGNY